jgi:hypothetical protein
MGPWPLLLQQECGEAVVEVDPLQRRRSPPAHRPSAVATGTGSTTAPRWTTYWITDVSTAIGVGRVAASPWDAMIVHNSTQETVALVGADRWPPCQPHHLRRWGGKDDPAGRWCHGGRWPTVVRGERREERDSEREKGEKRKIEGRDGPVMWALSPW